MKCVIFICFLFILISYSSFSQDTTERFNYYDGSLSYKIISGKDTFIISNYPDGKRESYRMITKTDATVTYNRWYENGKLMWSKEYKNGIQHGKSVFYNKKGIKVAVLIYEKGNIKDTIFIKSNTHLLFGKITSSSIIYGGVEREDGKPNISEYSGPYINFSMYAVIQDSIKTPVLISYFKSDFEGDFFIVAPEGKIGFFPKSIKIETLTPGFYNIPIIESNNGNEGWNIENPIEVKKENKIIFIKLHHFSVGYAP